MKRSKAAPTAFIGDRSRFWSCSMHPSRVSSDSSGRNAFPQRAVCDPRSANDALTISQTRDAMRARSMEYENWGRRSRGYSWIDNGWSPGMARYRAGRSRAEILVAPHCARHTWPLKRSDVAFRGAASIDLFPPLAAPPSSTISSLLTLSTHEVGEEISHGGLQKRDSPARGRARDCGGAGDQRGGTSSMLSSS